MSICRTRDSDESAPSAGQQREQHSSDEKSQSTDCSDRIFPTSDGDVKRDVDNTGDYDGPPGMQPAGVIEVVCITAEDYLCITINIMIV